MQVTTPVQTEEALILDLAEQGIDAVLMCFDADSFDSDALVLDISKVFVAHLSTARKLRS